MKVTYFGEVAEVTNRKSEDVILEHNALSDLISHLKSNYNLKIENKAINKQRLQPHQACM